MNSETPPFAEKLPSRAELIWLAVAMVFGSAIRLSFLSRVAVEHFDEGVYASNFWFGPEQGYAYPAQHLYAPPLLPTAIEWTMIIFNLIGVKPTGFIPMIPSLVAGIAMIPSIWWVGRRWFSPTVGLVSAWIVATSDFHACYSRAALTDVPVCLFILWAVYFTWNALVNVNVSPCATGSASALRSFFSIRALAEPVAHRKTEKRKLKSELTPTLPWRDVLFASGFTALAWWTKYNGWLPLAIGISGSAFWQLIQPKASRRIAITLKCLAAIIGLSFLAWSPVLWGLQSKGGYAAVAANHKQYIVGFRGWVDSARSQLQHVGMYDNWVGALVEPAVVQKGGISRFHLISQVPKSMSTIIEDDIDLARSRIFHSVLALFRFDFRFSNFSVVATDACLVANSFFAYLFPLTLLVISLMACVWKLRKSSDTNARIAACLLLAWILGMTLSTPFYHPYPRLVFPWLTAVWIGVGLAVDCWRNRHTASLEHLPATRTWSPTILESAFILWIGLNCIGRLTFGAAHAWSDRTETARAGAELAEEIATRIAPKHRLEDGAIAYTWGEPAILFAFKSAGMNYVGPIQNLSVADQRPQLPTFIAFGNQAFLGPDFNNERNRLPRCDFLKLVHFHQSHLVELDSKNTADFYLSDKSRVAYGSVYPTKEKAVPNLWLYRVKDD